MKNTEGKINVWRVTPSDSRDYTEVIFNDYSKVGPYIMELMEAFLFDHNRNRKAYFVESFTIEHEVMSLEEYDEAVGELP